MSKAGPEGERKGRVDLYDTTLRDGTQREGISLSCADKIRIAQSLDDLGVTFVEGGFPGSNPKDAEFFARAADLPWKHARLAAFGATRRAGIDAGEDPGLRAIVASKAPVATIFGKGSRHHVEAVLRTTLDENLQMIEDSVAFLVRHGLHVVYDAEHFFDGYREDASYAIETLQAAARGGANVVVLCDTNGGSLPWQVEAAVADVRARVGRPVGIHAHDDTGCAVANSLAAVRAGATHVQGTMNGYGERCGNANLCIIAPNLALKMGHDVLREGALARLTDASRFVAEIANLAPDPHMAYVGKSAFAHKGGVHVAALQRSPRAYEHVDPALVGNGTRVVMSELSGKATVLRKAEDHAIAVDAGTEDAILAHVKAYEARGFSYEAADASVALLLRRRKAGYIAPFRLVDYKVIVGRREEGQAFAEATIKIDVGGAVHHTAAEGNGPVSALDAALRKALAAAYPAVHSIQLVDYKVRILDGRDGTSATTRVLIDSANGDRRWTTVGASSSILEASWYALADSIEYGLIAALNSEPKDSET